MFWNRSSHSLLMNFHMVGRFFQKVRIEFPYDPEVLLLDFGPNNTKIFILKDIYTHTQIFVLALRTIDRIWNQLKCPMTNEWSHIYRIKYYATIKNIMQL